MPLNSLGSSPGMLAEAGMAQVMMTIFFSAAAIGALAIIVAMLADNLADVLVALGISQPVASPTRARLRQPDPVRTPIVQAPASPLRAAA